MELDLNDRDDVGKSLRKKIENRIAESLKILRGRDIGDLAVHDARRQFKQIRSALRMLRKSGICNVWCACPHSLLMTDVAFCRELVLPFLPIL